MKVKENTNITDPKVVTRLEALKVEIAEMVEKRQLPALRLEFKVMDRTADSVIVRTNIRYEAGPIEIVPPIDEGQLEEHFISGVPTRGELKNKLTLAMLKLIKETISEKARYRVDFHVLDSDRFLDRLLDEYGGQSPSRTKDAPDYSKLVAMGMRELPISERQSRRGISIFYDYAGDAFYRFVNHGTTLRVSYFDSNTHLGYLAQNVRATDAVAACISHAIERRAKVEPIIANLKSEGRQIGSFTQGTRSLYFVRIDQHGYRTVSMVPIPIEMPTKDESSK